MAIYSEAQAKAILGKAIAASQAGQCVATLSGSSGGNIRYALNGVSTSGHVSDAELAVEVAFGRRVGTATTNRFDDASIEALVRRAGELARLAPENPEFMPAIASYYRSGFHPAQLGGVVDLPDKARADFTNIYDFVRHNMWTT